MAGKKTLALARLRSATHCHQLSVYLSNYFSTFRRILQTTVWPRVPGGRPTWPGGPTGPDAPVEPTTQRNMEKSTVSVFSSNDIEINIHHGPLKTCHLIFVHNIDNCWPILAKYFTVGFISTSARGSCHSLLPTTPARRRYTTSCHLAKSLKVTQSHSNDTVD